MIEHIGRFSYLDNPCMNSVVEFKKDEIHLSYSRIQRIKTLVTWIFSKAIYFLTAGRVSIAYDDPRISILRNHLKYLRVNPSILQKNCSSLWQKFQELSKKDFIPKDLQKSITETREQIGSSAIDHIDTLEKGPLEKIRKFQELKEKCFLTARQKDQVDQKIDALSASIVDSIEQSESTPLEKIEKLQDLTKHSFLPLLLKVQIYEKVTTLFNSILDSIESSDTLFLEKIRQLRELRNKFFLNAGQKNQIDQKVKTFLDLMIDSIEQSDADPLEKVAQLCQLRNDPSITITQKNQIDQKIKILLDSAIDSIKKSDVDPMEKVEQFYQLRSASFLTIDQKIQIDQNINAPFSSDLMSYREFMSISIQQYIESLQKARHSRIWPEISKSFQERIQNTLYLGFIEVQKNTEEFTSLEQTSEIFQAEFGSLLNQAEKSKRINQHTEAFRFFDKACNTTSFDLLKGSVEPFLNEIQRNLDPRKSYNLLSLYTAYEALLAPVQREILSKWISEVLIYQHVNQPNSLESPNRENIPQSLERAFHFFEVYDQIQQLNLESLDTLHTQLCNLRNYLENNLRWRESFLNESEVFSRFDSDIFHSQNPFLILNETLRRKIGNCNQIELAKREDITFYLTQIFPLLEGN